MNLPRVTVLMPVHNGTAFLREAVDSVLAQTFTDFELLAVDDASTDASRGLLRGYTDPRVRLEVNERNLGQVATMNRGLALARGRYVARLDQDDVCLPRRLERQVEVLEGRPDVAVIGTWGYVMDATGRRVGATRRRVVDRGDFFGALALGECPLWHTSVLFRRDVANRLGGYDPAFGPAEDYELWTRLAADGHRAFVLPEYHLLYRLHGAQQSTTRSVVQRASIARAHERFLARFCAPERAAKIGALLRIDEAFWTACPARAERADTVEEARRTLLALADHYGLSAEERRSLRSTVTRRVGFGLAFGRRLALGPAWPAYALFFALSPMLVPHARGRLAPLVRRLRWLPYRWGRGRVAVTPPR